MDGRWTKCKFEKIGCIDYESQIMSHKQNVIIFDKGWSYGYEIIYKNKLLVFESFLNLTVCQS